MEVGDMRDGHGDDTIRPAQPKPGRKKPRLLTRTDFPSLIHSPCVHVRACVKWSKRRLMDLTHGTGFVAVVCRVVDCLMMKKISLLTYLLLSSHVREVRAADW
jgi:hypothetical protein